MYLNAAIMLGATLAAFVGLAKLTALLRAGRISLPWARNGERIGRAAAPGFLVIEQTTMLDGKRRLVLVRCVDQHLLLLTGGPVDLVVSLLPATRVAA